MYQNAYLASHLDSFITKKRSKMTYKRKVETSYFTMYFTGLQRGVSLYSVVKVHNEISIESKRKGIRKAIKAHAAAIRPMKLHPITLVLDRKPNFLTKHVYQ